MARNSNAFEVQVYKVDHWVLDQRFDTEDDARACARSLLVNGRAEGVRVIRDWARADGRHVETELMTEFRAVSHTITLAPFDETPAFCRQDRDFYAIDARIVMTRLLRNYIERLVVTPTEILHNYQELKRLTDKDNLLPSAVGRVSALQAEKAGVDGRARRDEVYGMVHALTERARLAGMRRDLPAIARAGFAGVVESLAEESEEERRFLATVVLSRDLVQMRNWIAKLDFLGELARENGGLSDAALPLVDAAIADVLCAPSVAQDLLGMQRSLGQALCSLIDLSRGRLQQGERAGDDRALLLNELFAFQDLDQSRRAVLDVVRRQLKGTHPLHRSNPAGEQEAFRQVLYHATTSAGVVGGAQVAEALILRYMRFLEAGGALGRRQAIAEVGNSFKDAKDEVGFLVTLAQSDLGQLHADEISARLLSLTGDTGRVGRFVDQARPIKNNLEGLTRLYLEVSSSPLPLPLRSQLADNIDGLLVSYIVQSRVVERLDDPGDLLRHRANRLMQLCAPGTLQSGRALAVVRQRVVDHLRQPNFDARYVEGIEDQALRLKALRDFYRLLSTAGFL